MKVYESMVNDNAAFALYVGRLWHAVTLHGLPLSWDSFRRGPTSGVR